jgi:hypothetical protein
MRERIWTIDPEEIWTVDLVSKDSQFRVSKEGENSVLRYPRREIPKSGMLVLEEIWTVGA